MQVIAQHSAESVAAGLDTEGEEEEQCTLESSTFASINAAANQIVEVGQRSLTDLVSRARVLLSSISASALAQDGDNVEEEGAEGTVAEEDDEDESEKAQEGEDERDNDNNDEEIDLDFDEEETSSVDKGADEE